MNLINRAKNMLFSPKTEWQAVAAETPNSSQIVMGYVVPLALAGAIAAFIGYGLIGVGGFLGIRIAGVNWGLIYALNVLVSNIVSVYISALVVDALAPSFGSEKNFGRSMQLVAYSATPSLVAGILLILPFLALIALLAGLVYCVYLWYIGLGPVKKTPEDKNVTYLVVSILVLIVVYWVISFIMTRILFSMFGIPVFSL